MSNNSSRPVGRHFLQIPGPTMLPDRVLRAMDTPIIDHRGPEFAKLAKKCLEGIKTIFKTTQPVIIYTATGTGAWEAALTNTLSPGDRVLMVEKSRFPRDKTCGDGLTPRAVRQLHDMGLAEALGRSWILTGDPTSFLRDVDEIEKVSIEDVKRVVKQYFAVDKSTTVVIPPRSR